MEPTTISLEIFSKPWFEVLGALVAGILMAWAINNLMRRR